MSPSLLSSSSRATSSSFVRMPGSSRAISASHSRTSRSLSALMAERQESTAYDSTAAHSRSSSYVKFSALSSRCFASIFSRYSASRRSCSSAADSLAFLCITPTYAAPWYKVPPQAGQVSGFSLRRGRGGMLALFFLVDCDDDAAIVPTLPPFNGIPTQDHRTIGGAFGRVNQHMDARTYQAAWGLNGSRRRYEEHSINSADGAFLLGRICGSHDSISIGSGAVSRPWRGRRCLVLRSYPARR